MWRYWGIQASAHTCLVYSQISAWKSSLCRRLTLFTRRSFWCWRTTVCFFQHSATAVARGSLLIGRSFNAIVNLVFADDGVWLFVVGAAVKSFAFRVIPVYTPNIAGERCFLFLCLEPFLKVPKRVVSVRDWNLILNPKIDKVWRGARGSDRRESNLIDFMDRHDLVDRFRLDHPVREIWTWIDSLPSMLNLIWTKW